MLLDNKPKSDRYKEILNCDVSGSKHFIRQKVRNERQIMNQTMSPSVLKCRSPRPIPPQFLCDKLNVIRAHRANKKPSRFKVQRDMSMANRNAHRMFSPKPAISRPMKLE